MISQLILFFGIFSTPSRNKFVFSKGRAIVVEGLFGNLVKMPVAPMVIIEYKICGLLWETINELREVIELQNQEKNK